MRYYLQWDEQGMVSQVSSLEEPIYPRQKEVSGFINTSRLRMNLETEELEPYEEPEEDVLDE